MIRSSPIVQQNSPPIQQGVNPLFAYLLVALVALIAGGGLVFYLLKSNNNNADKTDNAFQSSNSGPIKAEETIKQPAATQDQFPANSQIQTMTVPAPDFDFAVKNVRAGTADGKRLRVVADLTRTNSAADNPVRFDTLASGGTNGEAKIRVYARTDNLMTVKYESKQARQSGTVLLSPSNQGLEIKVIPRNLLYLRDVFFIPRSSANPNDRLVMDLCFAENCPSLRP